MATPNSPVINDPNAAPATDPLTEPVIPAEPTEPGEPVEPTEPAEPSGEPTEPAEPAKPSEPADDARRLPQYVRDLKEANPEAYKRAKAEFFDLTARRSVHPTVQAAREEHELVQSYGGREGLQELREDHTWFKQAAQQFLKGDKTFYSGLWEEDPVAAALGLSHMLELAMEKDPATFQPTIARLWDAEFKAVRLSEAGIQPLRAAIEAMPASDHKTSALAILQSIDDWQKSISSVASRAEDPRVKSLLAERSQRVENEEKRAHEEFLNSYKSDALNATVDDLGKVFDSFFKGRKLDAEDRNALMREAYGIANQRVAADKEFVEQRENHLKANDKTAALKLTQARFAREFPEAVKRIARRYGYVSGTKPAPSVPAPGIKPSGAQPQVGFTQVNAMPNPEDIDRGKTSREMLYAGRAILKNGRKVSWAHLRPKVA